MRRRYEMRKGLLAVSVILNLALTADGVRAGDGTFSVSIRPQQESIAALHEILLDITLTNTSGKLITLVDFPPQTVYTIEIKGPDGQPRPLTNIGEQIVRNAPTEIATHGALVDTRGFLEVHLLPGQVFKEVIRIDDMFDMTALGTYSVQLRRKIPEDIGYGEVESNRVNLNVRYNPVVEKYPPALRPK